MVSADSNPAWKRRLGVRCAGVGMVALAAGWWLFFARGGGKEGEWLRTIPPELPTSARSVGGSGASAAEGTSYTNQRIASVPWSIHVVRVARTNGQFEMRSAHAGGRALGLTTLSSQLPRVVAAGEEAVAGINGDFYQRDRAFAGDPRGLQVVDGELLSAPSGGVAFWVDGRGEPRTGEVAPRFEVLLPGGKRVPFGLNSDRANAAAVLYTPAAGPSTRSAAGLEWVLVDAAASGGAAKAGGETSLVLRVGTTNVLRVREVREQGGTPIKPGTWVLSMGPGLARSLPAVGEGAEVTVVTETLPGLAGVRAAIGGGPVLVREGRRQRIAPRGDGYESSSMIERHPRSAVGWNADSYFLVEVDGRQRGLSVGMTLEELGTFLAKLGCEEAMTLDGGGSATLWYAGRVRNSPCDGRERPIANSLVVVRKRVETAAGTGPKTP